MATTSTTPSPATAGYPSTSNIGSGLTGIDALIAQQMALVSGQAATAQKQSLLLQKQQKQQARVNNSLLAGLNAQLAANPNPSDVIPPAPSLSDAEVQQASDQVRIDAAKRMGQRNSILAGNQMGGLGGIAGSGGAGIPGASGGAGALSPATGLRSLLG